MALITSDCDAMRFPEHQMALITSDSCALQVRGPGTQAVATALDDHVNGTYTIRWIGTVTGQYNITIRLQVMSHGTYMYSCSHPCGDPLLQL